MMVSVVFSTRARTRRMSLVLQRTQQCGRPAGRGSRIPARLGATLLLAATAELRGVERVPTVARLDAAGRSAGVRIGARRPLLMLACGLRTPRRGLIQLLGTHFAAPCSETLPALFVQSSYGLSNKYPSNKETYCSARTLAYQLVKIHSWKREVKTTSTTSTKDILILNYQFMFVNKIPDSGIKISQPSGREIFTVERNICYSNCLNILLKTPSQLRRCSKSRKPLLL
jgi:hypothetical protein